MNYGICFFFCDLMRWLGSLVHCYSSGVRKQASPSCHWPMQTLLLFYLRVATNQIRVLGLLGARLTLWKPLLYVWYVEMCSLFCSLKYCVLFHLFPFATLDLPDVISIFKELRLRLFSVSLNHVYFLHLLSLSCFLILCLVSCLMLRLFFQSLC